MGEPILKLPVFRASLSHPLLFRRDRNCQRVEGLPIFRDEFDAFQVQFESTKFKSLHFSPGC